MASRPLEDFLQPGETVRFEAHARGWAPLTAGILVPYGVILGFAAFLALPGNAIPWPVLGTTIPVPVELPALALIFLIEVYRMAEFRSRLHVVTDDRVLLIYGIARTRLWHSVPVATVTGAQLVRGVPTLLLTGGPWQLPGLDALDLESMAAALHVPLSPPVDTSALSRRRRLIAIVVAVVFVVLVEVESTLQRRAKLRYAAHWVGVTNAAGVAEAALRRRYEANGFTVQRFGGGSSFNMPFAQFNEIDVNFDLTDRGFRSVRMVRVSVTSQRDFELSPKDAPVVVERRGKDREIEEEFLVELKRAFEAAGIVASWPEAAR